MNKSWIFSGAGWLLGLALACGAEKTPAFRAQDVDTNLEIGYGIAIADVQGDGKPDIIIADKHTIAWYENPTWQKHIIAENLTMHDNVCVAARDIHGNGKCEIAVGAEWNPSDTENSGAVFYLIPPADRTQKWEPVKLHAEPTTHRMKWVKRLDGRYDLVVVPLHGRGNKNGEGAGVKVLAYRMPANPHDEWTTEVICDDMHMTHNFDIVKTPGTGDVESLMLAGKEGIRMLSPKVEGWEKSWVTHHSELEPPLKGAGEVRYSTYGAGKELGSMCAAVEPMHGNQLVCYFEGAKAPRHVLDDKLEEGHALACADVLGLGRPQIVVGWRGKAGDKLGKVGIKMFVPKDTTYQQWEPFLIDDNGMACEDLTLADLNGDGKLDIIAAGRRTKNLKIYWNETK